MSFLKRTDFVSAKNYSTENYPDKILDMDFGQGTTDFSRKSRLTRKKSNLTEEDLIPEDISTDEYEDDSIDDEDYNSSDIDFIDDDDIDDDIDSESELDESQQQEVSDNFSNIQVATPKVVTLRKGTTTSYFSSIGWAAKFLNVKPIAVQHCIEHKLPLQDYQVSFLPFSDK